MQQLRAVPESAIRRMASAIWGEHERGDGLRPTYAELRARIGAGVDRIRAVIAEMERAGELPALAVGKLQAGALAQRNEIERVVLPLAGVAAGAAEERPREPRHASWDVVVEYGRAMRRIRKWAPGLMAEIAARIQEA